MVKYRGMRQTKGESLRTLSPEISTQRALVFNQKGKIPTFTRIVDFIPSSDVRSEDTSHASSFLRKFLLIHTHSELSSTGMLTSEPVAELQQKTQSAGLWDKSLAQTGNYLLLQGLWPECCRDFEFSRCKDTSK